MCVYFCESTINFIAFWPFFRLSKCTHTCNYLSYNLINCPPNPACSVININNIAQSNFKELIQEIEILCNSRNDSFPIFTEYIDWNAITRSKNKHARTSIILDVVFSERLLNKIDFDFDKF